MENQNPKRRKQKHIVARVKKGSIAMEAGIEPGDAILEINGEVIEDIFDYQFYTEEEEVSLLIEKINGELQPIEIEKDSDEDIGIEFENGLMDDYKSCHNKCIFCFIDQMPQGMRETLYFKDDDSRLSFLQGNYVTLTNMSEHDINRIIKYHLSPINVSFQTTNPELRCKMLHNRFAGEALKKVDLLYDAGITMNGQIVLCKGVNDGKELERSISDLSKYVPILESVSVVPVGLSKYRDGLYPLEPFTKEDAKEVLEMIHRWQSVVFEKTGLHFIHASDEWYILAEEELPREDSYDGYLQLENGVGMLRLLLNEFQQALKVVRTPFYKLKHPSVLKKQSMSIATGKLAYGFIKQMSQEIEAIFPNIRIQVFEITNHFFGEHITVSGLLCGCDIIEQLKDINLGERLLLPQNVLRSMEDVFLDDVTVDDMEKALQVKIDIVKSSGQEFIETILGTNIS